MSAENSTRSSRVIAARGRSTTRVAIIRHAEAPRAFSLIELLVVLAVTVILTSLLFPAFRDVRESAQRLSCASNMRQVGAALILYSSDHGEHLPPSRFGIAGTLLNPQEMMAANIGPGSALLPLGPQGDWDGIGWLVAPFTGQYVDTCACLYCASHHGEHPFERYAATFEKPDGTRIYTNYHYIGDRELGGDEDKVVRMTNAHEQVLMTDGLRTKSDFNHSIGANVLHGDCAVTWFFDTGSVVRDLLPEGTLPPDGQISLYTTMWNSIRKASSGPTAQ